MKVQPKKAFNINSKHLQDSKLRGAFASVCCLQSLYARKMCTMTLPPTNVFIEGLASSSLRIDATDSASTISVDLARRRLNKPQSWSASNLQLKLERSRHFYTHIQQSFLNWIWPRL